MEKQGNKTETLQILDNIHLEITQLDKTYDKKSRELTKNIWKLQDRIQELPDPIKEQFKTKIILLNMDLNDLESDGKLNFDSYSTDKSYDSNNDRQPESESSIKQSVLNGTYNVKDIFEKNEELYDYIHDYFNFLGEDARFYFKATVLEYLSDNGITLKNNFKIQKYSSSGRKEFIILGEAIAQDKNGLIGYNEDLIFGFGN